MKQTTNYSLNKIELEDSPPDITVLNPNFDKIDAEMKRLTDKDTELDGVINQVKTDYLPKTGGDITNNLTVKSKYVARSVNGEVADANGNIIIDVKGDVRSVNGIRPDEAGNVTIKAGVVSVNDVKPDPDTGDIDLGDRIKDASSRTDILEAVTQAGFNGKTLVADVAIIKNNYVRTVNGTGIDSEGNVAIDVGVKKVNDTSPDANGNVAIDVGVKKVNNTSPDANGNVTLDLSGYATTTQMGEKINISGSRGNLAGYESSGTASTINASARDANQTSSSITVQNGTSGTSWTKIVRVTSAVSVTLGSSWVWQGSSAPTIKSGGVLVCCWCGSGGIASFVSP